ncbi:hypothetical protein HXX76_008449 [Chlamydomonas incerta]|uniref:Protein kinase domain-containing protein n=1 Tax=Chlamydomonas incerta TaxID=51695 RepID=A0A835VZ92_CHLIN|nr:hypothetical protein HXX76_008449 [Chlamydomonas incerta]|eukprot:KAG2433390.1 hypothetical protein HXX76_008449 [Chlamydomonas incerta]
MSTASLALRSQATAVAHVGPSHQSASGPLLQLHTQQQQPQAPQPQAPQPQAPQPPHLLAPSSPEAASGWAGQASTRGGGWGGGGAGDESPAAAVLAGGLPSPMAPHDAAHAAYALIRCLSTSDFAGGGGGGPAAAPVVAPAAAFASSPYAQAAAAAQQQQHPPWRRDLIYGGWGAETAASSPCLASGGMSGGSVSAGVTSASACSAADASRQAFRQLQQPRPDAAADAARWLLGSSGGGGGGSHSSGGGGGGRGGAPLFAPAGSSAAGFRSGLQQAGTPIASPLLLSSADRNPSLQQQLEAQQQQQQQQQPHQGRVSLASVLAAAAGPGPVATSPTAQLGVSQHASPRVPLAAGGPISENAGSSSAAPSPAAASPPPARPPLMLPARQPSMAQQQTRPSAISAAAALPAKLKRFLRSARATLSPSSNASVTTTIAGAAPSPLGPASAAARARKAAYTPPEGAPQQQQQSQQQQAVAAPLPQWHQLHPAPPQAVAAPAAAGRAPAPAPTPLVASLRAQAAAAATARASDLTPRAEAASSAAWMLDGARGAADGVGASAAAAQATQAAAHSAVAQQAAVAAPVPAPAASATAAASGRPALMLCMSAALPPGMKRDSWSLYDYDVEKRLSKGASSAVYKATCKHTGMDVALKVYFLELLPDAVKHMVVRELEIHSSAVHPNIIQLYAAFETEKHVVLVMEYASRGDLYGIQRATAEHPFGRRQDEGRVVSVVLRPLLAALAFLHSRGICHRDIKPENVLFTSNWQLKLADFGVSIDLGRERAVTRAGTTCYMAPEVVRCPLKHRPEDNKNDPRLAYGTACDIWAVGVLAYELLVGFTPLAAARTSRFAGDDLCSVTLSEVGATGEGVEGSAHGGAGNYGAAHGGGSGGGDRVALMFPGSASAACRGFVGWCLATRPEERPTALQLWHHAWILPPSMAAYSALDAEL